MKDQKTIDFKAILQAGQIQGLTAKEVLLERGLIPAKKKKLEFKGENNIC